MAQDINTTMKSYTNSDNNRTNNSNSNKHKKMLHIFNSLCVLFSHSFLLLFVFSSTYYCAQESLRNLVGFFRAYIQHIDRAQTGYKMRTQRMLHGSLFQLVYFPMWDALIKWNAIYSECMLSSQVGCSFWWATFFFVFQAMQRILSRPVQRIRRHAN